VAMEDPDLAGPLSDYIESLLANPRREA
jgi:hypothetical protein